MCFRKKDDIKVTKYETNKEKNYYFHETVAKVKPYSPRQEKNVINIYPNISYQEFHGMGAAITEAAAYAYSLLPENKKKDFMNDYFGTLKYSLCRISIGSCDFSLSSYSYAKKHDLSDFSIEKDNKYIIPFIQDALKINPNLRFLASPWSPPSFMKNTKKLTLGGKLLTKYKQTYADYLVKFIKAYKELGININYITVQNEPNAIMLWESCLYNAEDEADFVANYLYPTFEKNNIKTKILVYDHNKEKLFKRAVDEFSNPAAKETISGIAFHWYSGNHFENIALCREQFPDKLLFHTEGCFGFDKENSFQNLYAHDIAEDLNAGVNGYTDWNILLDCKGGPNHKKNYCNSPVMLKEDNSDYIKTLAFYYIGHFSRFIQPGAHRIAFSKFSSDIKMTAFKNVDGSISVVMINGEHYNMDINICINNSMIKDTLEAQSIVTFVIK